MDASKSGTFAIGGTLTVNRLGFGAMRITGDGVWGMPKDKDEAIRVLKRAVELGVNFIDTSDAPGVWEMNGKPEHIREAFEGSLKRLKLDHIDLYQLHRIDPKVPVEDTIAVFAELLKEGKIKHFGLSEVSVEDIKKVSEMIKVDTVQNLYNYNEQKHADVLEYCEQNDIGFIPWNPLAIGKVADDEKLAAIAQKYSVTPTQLALAWILKKSPVMLPIPGTSSVAHLEENIAAANIELSDEDFAELESA
jgi:pyridoxine 4-dehydrogenase